MALRRLGDALRETTAEVKVAGKSAQGLIGGTPLWAVPSALDPPADWQTSPQNSGHLSGMLIDHPGSHPNTRAPGLRTAAKKLNQGA